MTSQCRSQVPVLRRPVQRQRGVTSIEYALLASLIAIVIVVAVGSAGDANALSWSNWVSLVLAALSSS